MNEQTKHAHYSLEGWSIYPDQNLIVSNTGQVSIEPKTMSVLLLMIEKQGQTISRDQFINEVWGGSIVTDNSLNQSISKLRKIFNDETAKPRIIETVSKRGYRLIVSVRKIDPDSPPHQDQPVFKRTYKIALGTLLLLITIGVSLWIYPKVNPDSKKLTPQIFSAVDGMERHPSFSRKEDQVVYVFGNVCNDESEIRIQAVGTDEIRSYAKFPGFKKFPNFSYDDKEIIFWNELDRQIKSTMYLLSVADTSVTKLLEIPTTVRGLDWSPDKKNIVYSARNQSPGSYCIYVFNKESGQITQMTYPTQSTINDLYPVFSHDGRSVAFIRGTSEFDFDIWTVNLETKNSERITFDNFWIGGLAWSEEGFLYSRLTGDDIFQLVSLNGRTRDEQVLFSSSNQVSAVDAGTHKIIFQTNTTAISISGYDLTTKHHRILFNSNFQENFPEFSPNGDRFAFISNRTGPFQLWIGDIAGTQTKKASQFRLDNVSNQPRWSPDEHFILVDVAENGKSNIYRISLNNGAATRFLEDASHPVFSPDGAYVYFNSRRSGASQIWKAPIEGGKASQITYNGGIIGFECRTDSSFYFMKETEDGIWQKKGQSERLILTDISASEINNWRLVDDQIFYTRRFNGIWRYDMKTKTSRQILTIDAGTCKIVNGLSISPNRQSLLFSSDERLESDLQIVDY